MKPDVSIIMYAKNGMPYFKRALRSVIDQTLYNIEILVIDGGSTDGTIECVKQHQSTDSRIQLFYSSQGSVGAQFNLGIKKAKGEYIGIVESDDFVLPEMYEKEFYCAKEKGCDVLRADNYIFFGENGKEIRMRTRVSHKKSNYNRVMCATQEPGNILIGGSFWTGIYRREFLIEKDIKMNETSGAAYQDFGFLFLTSVLAQSVYIMPEAFYCYRKDNPSSSCNRPAGLDIPIQEYCLLEKELKKRGIWEQYKNYFLLWKVRNERWFYFNLDNEMKNSYVHLLYKDIRESMKEIFIYARFPDKEREFLEIVEQGETKLQEYFREKDRVWNDSIGKIASLNRRSVYIFGAGNIGRILCYFLLKCKSGITGKSDFLVTYVDNLQEFWGTELDGIEVVSPHKALQTEKSFFVVCSENYANEICTQLRNAGVDDRNMAVCDDMDSCIRLVIKGIEAGEGKS